MAGAPLRDGHLGFHGRDMLTAPRPGGLAAGPAADRTTHGLSCLRCSPGSGGDFAGPEGVGELAEGVLDLRDRVPQVAAERSKFAQDCLAVRRMVGDRNLSFAESNGCAFGVRNPLFLALA